MFDPSEPTEDELLAAQSVPLEELRAKAKERAQAMGGLGLTTLARERG